MDRPTSETPATLVQVDNVHKSFLMGKEAVQALRGVSLDVACGEMTCLMGPSGSGKTTLLNIIGGLEEPSRGHVTLDGENIVALSEDALSEMRLNKMGFIFQSYNLLANFTAQENVEVPMALKGLGGSKRRQRAAQLLERVGLADRASHYPSELSAGQQQRVAIARALANNPPLLIGDEITADLDSATGFEVMEIVCQLNRERGMTVLYVTHDPRMAHFADRVIQLRDGCIVAENAAPLNTKENKAA